MHKSGTNGQEKINEKPANTGSYENRPIQEDGIQRASIDVDWMPSNHA